MATITMQDLRRADVRSNIRHNPYWITSDIVDFTADDLGALLFSFPSTKYGKMLQIHNICWEGIAAWTTGADILIGTGTIASEFAVSGDITVVDNNQFYETGDIPLTVTTLQFPTGGAWLTEAAAGTSDDDANIIVCGDPEADSPSIPVIYTTITSASAITAGTGRLHLLISEIPIEIAVTALA